jgi:hypothetical protein
LTIGLAPLVPSGWRCHKMRAGPDAHEDTAHACKTKINKLIGLRLSCGGTA